MKKVSLDKFSDYSSNFSWGIRHWAHKNVHFFYPKPLYILTLIFLAITCIFKLSMLKVFVPLFVVYWYQKKIAQRMQSNIKLNRAIPSKSKEGNTEIFKYELVNVNPFSYKNTLIYDFNNFSSDQEYLEMYFEELHPHQKMKSSIAVKANNGMGNKNAGPLLMFLTDSLGLNRISFVNDTSSTIKVFPTVHPTKSPNMLPNLTNISFGEFDTYQKGNNVNFYSTKEYQEGDSVNHINWKLSLKGNKLIVNEFESNTNASIYTVLLDDDRLHFGEGETSSLEYCKDLILSLLHANVRSNNDLGFLSHGKFIKAASGKQHLNALEIFIASYELTIFEKQNMYSKKLISNKPMQTFARKIKFHTDKESNLYVFTGLIPGRIWDYYLEEILRLRKSMKTIHLVIIHGYKVMIDQAGAMDKPWMAKLSATAVREIDDIKEKCRNKGVICSFVSLDSKFRYKHKVKEGFRDSRN